MSSKLTPTRIKATEGLRFIAFTVSLFYFGICLNSCKTGYGCKTNESYQVKTDKHGNLSMKRGKTKLFDEKRSKRKRS